MAESPIPKPTLEISRAPYLWAAVILTMGAGLLTSVVLLLRPQDNLLDVMSQVAKGYAPTLAAVLAYLKSDESKQVAIETHLSVNSRLDAFMKEHAENARSQGIIQGAADEQTRAAAEHARLAQALMTPAPTIVVAPPNQTQVK